MNRLSYYWEMAHRTHPFSMLPGALNYAKYKCLPRRAVQDVRRYTPQIAGLILTKRCNLNCGYCSAAKFRHDDAATWLEYEASLEKVRNICQNPLFANCILVDLLGGEPLLVKELDCIVAYLSERGHITNTSTNGLLLAARIVELKQAGISRINVSVYDENRAILERDLPGVNRVFRVHASMVLQRSLIENHSSKVLECARFIRDAGCRSLRFFLYRPMGVTPQPDQVVSETLPAYVDLRRRVNAALPGFCVWPQAIQAFPQKKLCAQLWQRVACDARGNMSICCGIDDSLDGPGSNLFAADPNEVSNHPTLVAMRKQLLDPASSPPEACRTCNLLGEPGW